MIRAEYIDNQRHGLEKWDKNLYPIKKISLKNLFNWKDNSAILSSPIMILTGKNGTGKSTCINAIKYAYQVQNGAIETGVISSIPDFQIKLVASDGNEIIVENEKIIHSGFKLPHVIDLSFNSELYSFFKNSSNLQRKLYLSTLEQYDPIPLPPYLLDILQFFIEKKIKSAERIIDFGNVDDDMELVLDDEGVLIENKEVVNDDDGVLIDFEEIVVDNTGKKESIKEYYRMELADNTKYDSYSMGSGEFFLNQFLWGLNDLKSGDLVLIEELENYLHSDVQKKIIELIHELANKKKIQFILTTHSPTIIDHVLRNSLLLIKNENNNVKPLNNCPNWLAKDILGTTIQNKKIVCVEDAKANSFLMTLISFGCPYLLNQIEIINCQGEAKILGIINAINSVRLTNFIGVLDGDSKVPNDQKIPHIVVLPGKNLPEIVVVNEVERNTKILSGMLLKSKEQIADAISLAKTRIDPHEWVSVIARELGEDPDSLWDIMIKIWYNENQNEASEFFKHFYAEFQSHA
jgi:AAA15 family ATPase/GTPase